MPSRNIVKQFDVDSYYHIYSRGVAKQPIFTDSRDKATFLKIIDRHLDSQNRSVKSDGTTYRKFENELELSCYCLMGNHFHLLVYQLENQRAISDFMRSVLTAYTMYFNRRHGRVGPLFQSIYKSSKISTDNYLLHITRYIHLNPKVYKTYPYSSLAQYISGKGYGWLAAQRILDLFEGDDYMEFVSDYEDHKQSLEEIKQDLADTANTN